MEWLVDLINNSGFPIAMCILMFVYMKEITKQHKEETDKLSESLNNNTLAIQKLVDKLDLRKEN